jgi:predicted negative regulator of RcsB-dependent stress response
MVATILICVALFAAGYRFYQSRADSKVTTGALIYLTQVKNETGDKTLDNLTELIQAGLTQSAHINLLDQDRVEETLQNMAKAPDTKIDPTIAREIAMRTGPSVSSLRP